MHELDTFVNTWLLYIIFLETIVFNVKSNHI